MPLVCSDICPTPHVSLYCSDYRVCPNQDYYDFDRFVQDFSDALPSGVVIKDFISDKTWISCAGDLFCVPVLVCIPDQQPNVC